MENSVSIAPQQRKVFPSIDLTKCVLAFFVVGIHARSVTLVDYHPAVWYFCNFAVTYFFLASGFFFRKKWLNSDWSIKEDLSGIKAFIVRILYLFLIWSLLFLPSEIYYMAENGRSVFTNIGLFSIDFLLRGKMGFGITLWYLHSCLVGEAVREPKVM